MKEKHKKIKVVFAINSLNIGGAEKLLVDQLKYFNREKFDLHIITLFKSDNVKDFYGLIPIDVKVYRLDFSSFFDIFSWLALAKILKKVKPDIVKSSLFFSNAVLRTMKIFFKYQIIVAVHNTHISKLKIHILIDRLLAKITYKIITDSQAIIDFTAEQENIAKNKFKVIYNGIDLNDIKKYKLISEGNNLKEELKISKEEKIILNIGRVNRQKNHKLLIESFFEFNKINKDYKLVIVGGGLLIDSLKAHAKELGINGKVIFTGTRKDLYKFYEMSDFFVLSSVIEGFSLVAVMALAFGLPVISTKVAGVVEYIENSYNGFLTESNSIDISKKMLKIANLNEQELVLYKKNCIDTANRFDIRKNVAEYEKLFMESISKYISE